ncbi:MAG: hypothetical protein ACRBN8_18295 [Nannocystales bacterium]
MLKYPAAATLLVVASLAGCEASSSDPVDGRDDAFVGHGKADGGIQEGTVEALAVLNLVNQATLEQLDDSAHVGLDVRAATGIYERRAGTDGEPGNADDVPFETLAELDAVPYVGMVAFGRLLEYALANGYGDLPEPEEGPTQEQFDAGVLLLANTATQELLDVDVGLDVRAADGIYERRVGSDGLFASIEDLDAVPYVGQSALQKLEDYALANGYVYTEAPDPYGEHFCVGPQFSEDDALQHLPEGANLSHTLPLFDFGARAYRRTCGATGCSEWVGYTGGALYGVIYGHDTNRDSGWRRGVGFTPAQLESEPTLRATDGELWLEAPRNQDEPFYYPGSPNFAWDRAVSFHARAPYDGSSASFAMNTFEDVWGETSMRTASNCFQIRNVRQRSFSNTEEMTIIYGVIDAPQG